MDTHFCNNIRIYFEKKYDCNKRHKTLEHLQIYFDRLHELSYKAGLIIFLVIHLCVFSYIGNILDSLHPDFFFCFDVRFLWLFCPICANNFTSLFSPFIYFYLLLYLYLKGIPVIYLSPFVIFTKFKLFAFLGQLSTLHQLCMFC